MNKEDVLKKSREENLFLDEREQHELGNSFGFGGVIVAILCVIFSTIKVFQDQRFYEFGSIIFGYMAATAGRSYIVTKKKSYLIQAVACSLAVVLGFIGYFVVV